MHLETGAESNAGAPRDLWEVERSGRHFRFADETLENPLLSSDVHTKCFLQVARRAQKRRASNENDVWARDICELADGFPGISPSRLYVSSRVTYVIVGNNWPTTKFEDVFRCIEAHAMRNRVDNVLNGMEHTAHQANAAENAHLWQNQPDQCMLYAMHLPCERRSSSCRQIPDIFFLRTSRTALIKLQSFAGSFLLIIGPVVPSVAQSASTSRPQNADSLGESLRNSRGREIHIFYIHGIGSDGPNDNDSRGLRKSICDYLKDCTSVAGVPIGEWDYADQDQFSLDAPVPEMKYRREVLTDIYIRRVQTALAVHSLCNRRWSPSRTSCRDTIDRIRLVAFICDLKSLNRGIKVLLGMNNLWLHTGIQRPWLSRGILLVSRLEQLQEEIGEVPYAKCKLQHAEGQHPHRG